MNYILQYVTGSKLATLAAMAALFALTFFIFGCGGDDTLEPTPQPTAAPTAAPATTMAPAPAPTTAASGRFLQVGAYASADSAEPQRQQLTSLGFSVTDRVEDGLVKLLVGPFEGAELDAAQSRLEAAGIESFPR